MDGIKKEKFRLLTIPPMKLPEGVGADRRTGPCPTNDGPIFDMGVAKLILAGRQPLLLRGCDDGIWLLLSAFSTYTQEALNHLVTHMGRIEGIEVGFRHLCPEGARALTFLHVDYCVLTDLARLDADAAAKFWWRNIKHRPIRSLFIHEPITEETALALAGGTKGFIKENKYSDGILSLSLPSISAEVAGALRHHNHELSLHIRDGQLSPDTAENLVRHVGYTLTLKIDGVLSADTVRALASNSAKWLQLSVTDGVTQVHVRTEL